ncbi:Nitroreductase family [Bifidobacterium goeldii]|uniref:Nitroreductase family n=1 Tax=Bifidobacterium goeldii TaxID=2306975 RepID=A0A430FFZ6_9BIFI|nr:nitroreductase family protein [Bifidobacterium goeldii]RSX51757.1 Nitroreductase family [Bifidobacterium goeldii]
MPIVTKIKLVLKNIMPKCAWVYLQKNKFDYKLSLFYKDQRKRFFKYCSSPWNTGEPQLVGKLVYFTHRIEKGLSHTDFRPRFGKRAFSDLAKVMVEWHQRGYSLDNEAYIAASDVFLAYRMKHEAINEPLPDFYYRIVDSVHLSNSKKEPISGVNNVLASEKKENCQKNFSEIFNGRTSVREFDDSPVDFDKIHRAINLSMKTPSVCNRQSFRVTLINNTKIIAQALDLQGGWRGYKKPPVLALITSDISTFVGAEERNEPYIDGGLFTMSFLLSLEYESLATCPLNAMFQIKQEKQMRSLLNIPDSEVLIAFVAIGNFADSVPAPKSFRFAGKSITRIIH